MSGGNDTMFQFSRKDILGGKVYEPDWYRVKIVDVSAGPSKNLEKPSTNYELQCEILFNATTGEQKYAEHPIKLLFNSRAMGFAKGLLIALGVPEESIDENTRFDFKGMIGKEVDVFIENDTYEGRTVNKVNHKYRAPRVTANT